MTDRDKSKAIEVLLCCGDLGNDSGVCGTANNMGVSQRIRRAAYSAWSSMEKEEMYNDDWTRDGIALCYTDAAYSLIESSATLRRKWFGR